MRRYAALNWKSGFGTSSLMLLLLLVAAVVMGEGRGGGEAKDSLY
jgi:hypothetical protein